MDEEQVIRLQDIGNDLVYTVTRRYQSNQKHATAEMKVMKALLVGKTGSDKI